MDENEVGQALEVLTGVPASVTVLIIKVMPWKWVVGLLWKGTKALFAKVKKSDPVPSALAPVLPPMPTIVNHGTTIINYGTVNYYQSPSQ